VDEQQITKYLLGALPEAEIEEFDEMSVSDENFAQQLRIVENDLVDAYVKGELSGEALKQFQTHYLESPLRREKVFFAQTFHKTLDKTTVEEPEKIRIRETHRPSFFRLPQVLAWSAAGVLLLLCGYLLFENYGLRSRMDKTLAEQNSLKQREFELQNKLQQQQASDSQTKNELASVQQRLADLEKELADLNRSKPGQDDVKLIAMNLLPQTRGISKRPVLSISDARVNVMFNLELESDDFPLYQTVLKNSLNGEIVWQSGKVKAEKNLVQIQLPGNNLKTGSFLWELSGVPDSGTPEVVGTYSFQVIAP
jgi:hypothetical protein